MGALYQHHVERAAAGGAPSAHGAGVASGGQVRGEALVTALDVLRRTPGDAPRCDMPVLLKAHDAAQVLLVARGWLPAAIIAPGSSSARLSETFPEEMCPHY